MKTVLAIGAHPDDIEIGCGGLLALLKNRGYTLHYLIATDGEEGHLNMAPSDLADIRRDEAKQSAAVLGAVSVKHLGLPDGSTNFSKAHKNDVISYIREVRPQVILTHAKDDHFPDHRLIHDLTIAAVQAAAGPWYPQAGGIPHQVDTILGYEVWAPINTPQFVIDISDTVESKLRALREHKSQIGEVNYLEAVVGLARYRGTMSMRGKYAEAFEVIRMGDLL